MSWSPARKLAGYYAYNAWLVWERVGEPVLLRREITRDQVLAYFSNPGGEAVVRGDGSWVLDTTDAGEIAALATSAELMIAEGEKLAGAQQSCHHGHERG
jgi:hypothetical protein